MLEMVPTHRDDEDQVRESLFKTCRTFGFGHDDATIMPRSVIGRRPPGVGAAHLGHRLPRIAPKDEVRDMAHEQFVRTTTVRPR
jgi:hypothetical protein